MKHQNLELALDQIHDRHIAEAAAAKRKRFMPWLGAIAAVLALALIFHWVKIPMAIQAKAVCIAAESRTPPRPDHNDYADSKAWLADLDTWNNTRDARLATANNALTQAYDFFDRSSREFLTRSQDNVLYSPINAYIGLAMAAELTAGNTRQELLDALGAADTAALRAQVSALWESVYQNNGNEICTIANSLWLDSGVSYNQSAMDILGHDYYASVYQRTLNNSQTVKDVSAWLNNHTGGFLKTYTGNIQVPEEALLLLYSTIYFQGKWADEFNSSKNTQDVFHGASGNTICTYMNASQRQMHYYWGDTFGAVSLNIKGNRQMWLILPDEGLSTDDVLAQSQYLDMILSSYEEWENKKYMKVNLSVPKFDVSSTANLKDGFVRMGISDLFNPHAADFSASLKEPAFITAANQAVRVSVDEQGVTAAAYIELPAAGAAMPPEEIIDFTLDRPFLFVITGSGNIPLFAGVVNQP